MCVKILFDSMCESLCVLKVCVWNMGECVNSVFIKSECIKFLCLIRVFMFLKVWVCERVCVLVCLCVFKNCVCLFLCERCVCVCEKVCVCKKCVCVCE